MIRRTLLCLSRHFAQHINKHWISNTQLFRFGFKEISEASMKHFFRSNLNAIMLLQQFKQRNKLCQKRSEPTPSCLIYGRVYLDLINLCVQWNEMSCWRRKTKQKVLLIRLYKKNPTSLESNMRCKDHEHCINIFGELNLGKTWEVTFM